MIIAYWIIAGLLALAFLAAGLMKLVRPKDALVASGMGYAEDFSAAQIKLIGLAEVIGAIGLILPMLVGVVPVLGPIAAIALAVLMTGAIVVHIRRKEGFIPPLVLDLLAVVAAVLGFLSLG